MINSGLYHGNTLNHYQKGLIWCLFMVILFLLAMCSPALAHTAAEMGISPDQYDQGIPVYWPYHAFFMTTGLVLLLSGFIVMRYHKTRNWYKSHQGLQAAGGLSTIAGLSISMFMIQASGVGHLRYTHGLLGAGTVALIISTLLLGLFIIRAPGTRRPIRLAHGLMGGASIILVMLNIALGLSMMSMVLAQ